MEPEFPGEPYLSDGVFPVTNKALWIVAACLLGCNSTDSGSGSSSGDLLPTRSSTVSDIQVGTCLRQGSLRTNVQDTSQNNATRSQGTSGTRISIPSAGHSCAGNYSFNALVVQETLQVHTKPGTIISECFCQSEVSFSLTSALPDSVVWLDFDGRLYPLD